MPNNNYRKRNKQLGLCTECSKPAYPGKAKCGKHLMSHRIINRNYYKKNSEKVKKRIYKTNSELKEKHICICRTPLMQDEIEEGYVRCVNCRQQLFRAR